MQIDVQMRPACSVAKVSLGPGETLTSEGGAMIAMNGNIHIETTTHKKSGGGGIMSGLKRVISGESFFINHYTAGDQGGDIYLAPTLHGDLMVHALNNESLIVQSGSFLASEAGVSADFNWQGLKSVFSGESLFWLNINGSGKVIINSFGEIYPVDVDGEYIVDTGHIVAFEPSLKFDITKAGQSWISSFLGGEGFVCKFRGTGRVWCQSHNPRTFGMTVGAKLKPR